MARTIRSPRDRLANSFINRVRYFVCSRRKNTRVSIINSTKRSIRNNRVQNCQRSYDYRKLARVFRFVLLPRQPTSVFRLQIYRYNYRGCEVLRTIFIRPSSIRSREYVDVRFIAISRDLRCVDLTV